MIINNLKTNNSMETFNQILELQNFHSRGMKTQMKIKKNVSLKEKLREVTVRQEYKEGSIDPTRIVAKFEKS
jgi:hypothetical protein